MIKNMLNVQHAKAVMFVATCAGLLYFISSKFGCSSQDIFTLSAAGHGKTEDVNIDMARNTKELEDTTKLIQELTQSLQTKLNDASISVNETFQGCMANNISYDDDKCTPSNGCLRKGIPEDLTERIKNILSVSEDKLPICRFFWSVIEEMRAQLKTKQKVIIVNAVSSNHLKEWQAMLKNFHENVFPFIKNFTMIVYDIGLEPWDRMLMQQNCRCQVLKFPCEKLPGYFCNPLKSFAWKIFIIAAHLEQTEILWWADSSISIYNSSAIPVMFERTRKRGVQLKCGGRMNKVPYHTLPQMPVSFGDSPCLFTHVRMVEGGFGFYHNEPLIQEAVIKPLVGCASHRNCLVPKNQLKVQRCPSRARNKTAIGLCHRVDQSAMSIVLARLFREKYYHFAVQTGWFMTVNRRQKSSNYLIELDNKRQMN